MPYFITPAKEKYRQITWEDIVAQRSEEDLTIGAKNGTVTTFSETVPEMFKGIDPEKIINKLKALNEECAELHSKNPRSLYRHWEIPKKGKPNETRPIDAPCKELRDFHDKLKTILESGLLTDPATGNVASHHTAAYAYIKERSIVDNDMRHLKWGSRWYLHMDFKGFFPHTTCAFVMSQLALIYPFSEIIKNEEGKNELEKALGLCFLNGGLPQGSTISPFITNLMMVPFDHRMSRAMFKFDKGGQQTERFIYTRYADDITISCRVGFPYQKVVQYVQNILAAMNAPFWVHPEKTRYGNVNGRNFHLGLMINNQGRITVGHERKAQFKAWAHNYLMDRKNEIPWEIGKVYQLSGVFNYYRHIEPMYFDNVHKALQRSTGMNLKQTLKADIKGGNNS